MQPRMDYASAAPAALRAMSALEEHVRMCGLEHSLLELVKIRASQINGCASCLAMHVRDARKAGDSDERMHLLNAWDEAPIYTARERAAMAWTEAVTLVTEGHVPDAVYEQARQQFSEKELVDLTMAIVAINSLNRLAIAFRRLPETDAARVNSA